ncbi:MAG: hypothetical protein ACK4GM_07260 [Tabrizicola sp.]
MLREWMVDLLGWAVILLWLGLSAYFFWNADPVAFQAVGVIGISAGVGYFVFQRHAVPHPYGTLEIESLTFEKINLCNEAALRALAHTAIIAKAIVDDAQKRGEPVSQAIVELASVKGPNISSVPSSIADLVNDRQRAALRDRLVANDLVLRARRNSEILQASVVILGTLQSGLGSYFVDLFKSGGA